MNDSVRGTLRASIGVQVRTERRRVGMTMRQLARRAGTSQPFISNIENGRVHPSLRTVTLLAQVLGVSTSELLPAVPRSERSTGARRPAHLSRAVTRSQLLLPSRTADEPGADVVPRDLSVRQIELGDGDVEPAPRMHDGEEFALVLAGRAVLRRESQVDCELSPGESIWISGSVPHRFAAPTGSTGAVVLVTQASGTAQVMSDGVARDGGSGLGSRIRALRMARGLSGRHLADLAGISQPLLSSLERETSDPSIPTLYAVTEALGIGPADLLDEPVEAGTAAAVGVTSAGHAIPARGLPGEASGVMRLLHAAKGRHIEAYRLDLPPLYRDDQPFEHTGEDVIHVMAGTVLVRHGEEGHHLEAGDTLWLTGTTPHSLANEKGQPATVVIITAR